MTTVLIVDSCKPSLVMSSEIFKDKVSGVVVDVATDGKECIGYLTSNTPDMCVVDFDLPDTDGIHLVKSIRKVYSGPVLLTAYPDPIVEEVVKSDLFVFSDASSWIPKPVKFDALSEKIEQFLLQNHRITRRFDVEQETLVVGKGAGRGKRAPKVSGKIINVSVGGLCVELDEPMKMKGGQELTISLSLPSALTTSKTNKAKTKTTSAKPKTKTKAKSLKKSMTESKVKCSVAWIDRKNHVVGFEFNRLTDVQKKGLEALLRNADET